MPGLYTHPPYTMNSLSGHPLLDALVLRQAIQSDPQLAGAHVQGAIDEYYRGLRTVTQMKILPTPDDVRLGDAED